MLIVVDKSNQAQQDITSLREELQEAKLERGQKVQYDEFTRTILKKTPKSRAEQIT
jgi:predicted amino acid-binding ACT domain protein